MFIWDFVVETIFQQILNWVFVQMMEFLNEFFALITNMGADLFNLVWIKALIVFFNYLGWALFTVGLILAVFETAIAYQNGQVNINSFFINILKGFLAASLFTTLPVELFKFAISMQVSLSSSIIQLSSTSNSIGGLAIISIGLLPNLSVSLIFSIFLLFVIGYTVIKVFFSNLKRGGILLTQIAVGSLYMISIPRGFLDGFIGWSKQVIALCLTTFLQSLFLIISLLIFKDNFLLGVGLLISTNEIPRIAEQFGLDTSIKGNMFSTVYATQSAFNIVKSINAK